MLKRLGAISFTCLGLASVSFPAMADSTMVDHYFTSMQISVDSANELGPKCVQSLKVQKTHQARMTGACTSFNQAYGIVLDQADRLNRQMANSHQGLPAHDARLTKLQRTTKQLNGYASIVDSRTGK